jgi:BASS family bile acid:Na+ symporter
VTAASAALAALLVAAMLAVGTTVDAAALRRLWRRPAMLVGTVTVNVVVVPGVALVVTCLSGVDGPVAVGMMVAAAAPGGASGALLAHHAKGTPAVAVGLQAVLALAGIVAVPVWLGLAAWWLDVSSPGLPAGGAVTLVFGGLVAQLVPLLVGMWLRAARPTAADVVRRWARRVADVLLAAIVVWSLVANADRLVDVPAAGYLAMAVVVLVSLVAYALPGLDSPGDRAAAAMVTAVRNLSLALFVAGFAEDADQVILTVLVYGLLMYVVATAALWPIRRRARRAAEAR